MIRMNGAVTGVPISTDETGCPDMRGAADAALTAAKEAAMLYIGKDLGLMLRMPFEKRLALTKLLLETCRGHADLFVECGAASVAEVQALCTLCADCGAAGVCVTAPVFFGASEAEQAAYFSAACACVPDGFCVYLRNCSRCSNNSVTRGALERMMAADARIVGLIDDATDAVRMRLLAQDKTYSLVTDSEAAWKIARQLGYDALIL